MRVAINQPYFIPYAGYHRLFNADLFIILDDVQYSNSSWTCRNKLERHNGSLDWLSFPLKKKPLATKINEIEFAKDARMEWNKSLRKFKVFDGEPKNYLSYCAYMAADFINPLRALTTSMELTRDALNMRCMTMFSSDIRIPKDIHGQDRVLEICRHFQATEYINSPGGVKLYDPKKFKKIGVDLKFLTPYENKTSILERLCNEDPKNIRKDIDEQTRFQ